MLGDRITRDSLRVPARNLTGATADTIELAPLAIDIAGDRSYLRRAAGADPEDPAAAAIIVAAPVYEARITGSSNRSSIYSTTTSCSQSRRCSRPQQAAVGTRSWSTAGHAWCSATCALSPSHIRLRRSRGLGASELGERIGRATAELAALVHAPGERRVADRAWSGYQHQFAGNVTRAERTAADIDLDSLLMRLAAGGRATPRA